MLLLPKLFAKRINKLPPLERCCAIVLFNNRAAPPLTAGEVRKGLKPLGWTGLLSLADVRAALATLVKMNIAIVAKRAMFTVPRFSYKEKP